MAGLSAAYERAIDPGKARRASVRGAHYPRAAVVRTDAGQYIVLTFTNPWAYFTMTDHRYAGKPSTYTSHMAAFNAARREVHALRSRRHPAGMSWLKAGAS